MKRIFLLFALLALVACSKSSTENKSYTIEYNVSYDAVISTKLTIFEYNDIGEKVGYHEWSEPIVGSSQKFSANLQTSKIKIYVKMQTKYKTFYYWVQQVFYMKGSDTRIVLAGTTVLGPDEP